eukprot:gnl/TRDRNA2_/TRDRNA2_199826_c0_seq1.p1 gnl/TRDRNA2_/TRDRNA2_199826_c0~~gnl/TRDRNA2_/TRDRNA2_199826_c0_seq1.p1  ORF type:complete len:570 (+),score=75.89 gnl/TRDRNA2_/TRDRNA2_199826_c0_seq1:35-1711(+)
MSEPVSPLSPLSPGSTDSQPRPRRRPGPPPLDLKPLRLSLATDNSERSKNSSPSLFDADFSLDAGPVLGAGTMAVVRLATRRADGVRMAVKHIRSEDEEVMEFTRTEYNLVRTLKHPAIIQFESMYEGRCSIWICMELCSDGCVQSYVKRHKPFQNEAAQPLFMQLLRGVNYLHHKRVVHRDLKPPNLLLKARGAKLKITDFNSAKQIGSTEGKCVMLTDRGTHIYSAPELKFGRMWNERIDIWACGLCFYFMLCGVLPFNIEHREAASVLSAGKLPNINWEGIGEIMQNLILQCLDVNMHDRPPAMQLLMHKVFSTCTAPAPESNSPSAATPTARGLITHTRSNSFGDELSRSSDVDAICKSKSSHYSGCASMPAAALTKQLHSPEAATKTVSFVKEEVPDSDAVVPESCASKPDDGSRCMPLAADGLMRCGRLVLSLCSLHVSSQCQSAVSSAQCPTCSAEEEPSRSAGDHARGGVPESGEVADSPQQIFKADEADEVPLALPRRSKSMYEVAGKTGGTARLEVLRSLAQSKYERATSRDYDGVSHQQSSESIDSP